VDLIENRHRGRTKRVEEHERKFELK